MTFWWRTLCLVPAGSLSRSLLLSWHNDKLQVESWVNFVALSVSVDEGFLCLSSCPPGCHLLFAIWGPETRCPAWRGLWNWWSFCCFGKWGADNATTLTQQHALLLFFHSSLLQPQLFFFWLLINTVWAGFVVLLLIFVEPHELFALFLI